MSARARFLGASCLALGLAACGGETPRQPDVLFISLDSVRADALRFDDARLAPHLVELAQRGVVFEEALAGSSWTLPGHAQMFTGRPPALHGVQLDDISIDPQDTTLGEALAGAGWFGVGLWTGWYLAGDYGFARGFQLYENRMTGGEELDAAYQAAIRDGDVRRAQALFNTRDVSSHRDITTRNVVDRARDLLQVVDDDQPLFLFAHLFDPHYDYIPPAPWDTAFDPDYRGSMNGQDFYLDPRVYDPTQTPPRQISERDLDHVRALYQGEIAWTDQELGRLFEAWDAVRDLDNTLIVITSDHGEEFFEHGGRGHRHTLFDELLRVPLLIVPPGGAEGGRRAQQVDLSDLMPTILDYCGLEAPPTVVGRSLRPLMEDAAAPGFDDHASLSSLVLTYQPAAGPLEYTLYDTLRTPAEKLTRVLRVGADRELRLERSLWYDLRADPRERSPITDPADRRLAAAYERLEGTLDALRAQHAAEPPTPLDQRGTLVRELFQGELGHLGYGGDEPGAGEEDEGADSPGLAMPWPPGPHPRVER